MKPTPSPDCMHCGKPHGKPLRWIFASCDACDAKSDQQMSDVSDGLITASCPRCDLLFSVDMKTTLTDAEREAVEIAENLAKSAANQHRSEGAPVYAGHFGRVAATLRKLLERLS